MIKEYVVNSAYFGLFLTILSFQLGLFLHKKFKISLFNPQLVSIVVVILVLLVADIDYDTYNASAHYLSYFLTPATVCLAIPLYKQLASLKAYPVAIFVSVACGVLASLFSIWGLSALFGLNHELYVTLLPKSITTAIGMGVSDMHGGIVTITIAAICVTGVLGNTIAEFACRLFGIKEPVARGLAIGTSSHASGTAKAMLMGEVEGAMSSLAIVVAGIMTVVMVSFFVEAY